MEKWDCGSGPTGRTVQLEFDCAIPLAGHEAARRSVVSVPPDLSFVSDLLHHLHRRFQLPQEPLVLSVDGFALLPAQRVTDVLRDCDALHARLGSGLPRQPAKRRRGHALESGLAKALRAAAAEPGPLGATEAAAGAAGAGGDAAGGAPGGRAGGPLARRSLGGRGRAEPAPAPRRRGLRPRPSLTRSRGR